MDNQDLTKILEALHTELQHTETLDDKGQELLRDLDAEIRGLLARTEKSQPSQPLLLNRLQESVEHFEVTHPTLTELLSELLTSLSNAGI
jgi:hypothetical protein